MNGENNLIVCPVVESANRRNKNKIYSSSVRSKLTLAETIFKSVLLVISLTVLLAGIYAVGASSYSYFPGDANHYPYKRLRLMVA